MAHAPEKLIRTSDRLAAEIERLVATASRPDDDRAATEAFTLHARVLLDFLTDKPKGREVAARSYVSGWKGELPKGAGATRIPKGKQLVRLTTKRVDIAAVDAGAVLDGLRPELLRFTEAVPDALVAADFKARAHAALDPVAAPDPDRAAPPVEEPVAAAADEAPPEPSQETPAAAEPDPYPDPLVTPRVPGLHRDEHGAIVRVPVTTTGD